MDSVDVVAVATLVFLGFERLFPAIALPRAGCLGKRRIAFQLVQVGLVYLGVATWGRWMPKGIELAGDALVPVVVFTGFAAAVILFHAWRRTRLDKAWPFGATPHPVEWLVNGVLLTLLLGALFGMSPAIAALVTGVAAAAEALHHAWDEHRVAAALRDSREVI
jgi:hypothetical protein